MIERIEIQYFRSIYRANISGIKNLNVITGKNDVGKSNVLKALNLFFNNCIIEEGDYTFKENYNLKRLNEVRKDTIKGKQFIQIKVTFNREGFFEKTLPQKFTITKKWNRDSILPIVTDDVETQLLKENKVYNERTKASLTRFLNKCKYIYIPAIKDERIFKKMLSELQEEVFVKKLGDDKELKISMSELASRVSTATSSLSDEFKSVTNIESSIETPTNIGQLYQSLNIVTKNEDNQILLKNRGDGIQVRYLPSIINYLATNSNEKFIWGFEEPENSLEFNMARRMADDFFGVYCNNSQIFVTTHSPAFIDLGYKTDCSGYRCFVKDSSTSITDFKKERDEELLSEELGYASILQQQYEEYKAKKIEIENKNKVITKLLKEIDDSHRPIVLTEGKTDAKILLTAWKKLYEEECPFEIKSCSLIDSEQELGGCDVLSTILKGVREDSPKRIIGLFDNDEAGQKSYKLDKNFIEDSEKQYKVNRSKKGYALMLPASTDHLKKIADGKNLSIEFMFSYESLQKEVSGKKLIIQPTTVVVLANGRQIGEPREDDNFWYLGKIDNDTKTYFSDIVVPTLDKNEFKNFVPLFNTIKRILAD